MKQYLLMVIAALTALIAAMLSVNVATRGLTHEYENRSLPKRHVVPEPLHATGEAPEQEPKHSGMPMTSAEGTELDEAATLPLPLMSMEMMSEVEPSQLPPLDAGMVNVTGGRGNVGSHTAGYHVGTHPDEFVINVPYDPSLLPQGFSEDDIQTYVYDRQYHRWVAIQRDSVNEAELLVCSRYRPWEKGLPHTQNDMSNPQDALAQVQDVMSFAPQGEGGGDSPLDFVNAVLKTPEMPETSAYTPTSIKELKAADPLEGLTLMQPPTANNSGTANLSYPIEIPAGRQGMQPNLALSYSSGGGNGWLGIGWDISVPSITVETRWGVPRYDSNQESEVYVYEGEQLVSKDANGEFRKMRHRTNEYLQRNSGNVQFWPRKNEVFDSIVRHGTGPGDYWWSVTHKNGVTDYYGKYASDSGVNDNCVLRTGTDNASGAVAHWALAESVDPFGNSVRYYYDVVFVDNGKQIYIDSISYTCFNNGNFSEDGYYSVVFGRNNDEREDVIVSCNRGFKEVTASTLCHIKINAGELPIRAYVFSLENKADTTNFKSRLKVVFRSDEDAENYIDKVNCNDYKNRFKSFHNHLYYVFDYYDMPSEIFGEETEIHLQNDQIGTPLGNLGINDEVASALGASQGKSWNVGGTASVGLGPVVCLTSASVGGNFDYSRSESEGLLTMIDLDGDGLADKVFKNDGVVYYRKQYKTSEYTLSFGDPIPIEGISDFLKENSSTTTWGLQASAGCAYSGSWPTTTSTTSTYFADVNGDGLPDLVTENGVLFNIATNGGNVQFKSYYTIYEENQQANMENPETVTIGSTSDCGGIIFDGKVNDSVVCRYDLVLDTVIFFKVEESVKSMIKQLVDSLEATGNYECNFTTLNGQYDVYVYKKVLRCEPLPLDPDIDVVKVWVAPRDGDITIYSDFMLDIDTTSNEFKQSHYTNGVRYTIQHEIGVKRDYPSFRLSSMDKVELYNQRVPIDSALIKYRTKRKTSVTAGDLIFFRMQSNGNRMFDFAKWQQTITYSEGGGYDRHGMPICCYNSAEDFVVSGEKYFSAYKNGVVNIDIDIHTTDVGTPGVLQINSSSPFVVSPVGTSFPLSIPIVSNMNTTLNYNSRVLADDTIAFILNAPYSKWGNIEIHPHIKYCYLDTTLNPYTIRWDTLDYYPPVTYFSIYDYLMGILPMGNVDLKLMEAYHRYFGPLYRGWGQCGYNNNAEGNSLITDPIDITTFHLTNYDQVDTGAINTSISESDVSNNNSQEGMSNYYASNKMYNPLGDTRWIEMEPDSRNWVWKGYGNINFVGRNLMSNTRLPELVGADPAVADIPEYDYPVPAVTVGAPKTIRKQNESRLKNHSLNVSPPLVPISVGTSISNGNNTILTDYMDLNGDRYPDIIGGVTIQYSQPWGGLGDIKDNGGTTLSNTYSTGQTFGASYSLPKRGTSNNPSRSKISFDGAGNVGVSHGGGMDETSVNFMDMNGDGLPDRVSSIGNVQLNIGYEFLPAEDWQYENIRKGNSQNYGLSIGGNFNVGQASIGGGLGVNKSENNTETMLIDMNGDGLPDKVSCNNSTISIIYNLGNGKWSNSHSYNQIPYLSYGSSFSKSINASVTLGFTFLGFLKVCAGVSTSPYNTSFSKDSVQLTDINGDGYVDYVTSSSEDAMTIRYNTAGKTNLLRKVTNFTGSTIELDYDMPQACFEKPQRSWNLSEVRTFNRDTADVVGGNRTLTRFDYAHPNYNRYERMDYGYDSVVTKQYVTDNGDSSLYRYTVEEYENLIFNKRGRKTRQCIYDAEGHPYIETIYNATLADINHPDSVYGGNCPEYVFVKEEAEIRNHYEGDNIPGLTTVILRSYDNKRNIVTYTYLGDTSRMDDYFKAKIEYATGLGYNLISLPTQIEVRNTNNDLQQKRTASYGTKGELETLTQYNTTENAEYGFVHDSYGNLTHSVLPANHNGERLEFYYTYDSVAHTYPVRVQNESLGYYSSAEYDLRFGKPTKTVDINGNEMRYEYDSLGRTVKITAPNELFDNIPYTIKMNYTPYRNNNNDTVPHYLYARTDHYDRQHPNDPISTVLISDGWGRTLQTKKDAEISGHELAIVTGKVKYDCFGRTVAQYHPVTEDTSNYLFYNANFDSLTITETHYDILDRQTLTKLPTGDSTLTTYGFGTAAVDNRNCLRTDVTDPNGNTVTTLTDGRGLTMSTIAPYGTATEFLYDNLGRLTSSIDPDGFTTTYQYDMLGRMTRRSHPDAGIDVYAYDPAGNTISHTNGKGNVVQYAYHYNQLTDVTYPACPPNNVHYTYGSMGTSNNRAGKIATQEDASGWQEFFYGKMGEVIGNIRTFALPYETKTYTFAMAYEYDSWNRIQSMTYPDGEVVSYKYNRGGMLQRVMGRKNRQTYTYIDSLLYNKFELKERVLYGNGASTSYHYDILLRMDTLKSWDGSTNHNPMQAVAYSYDPVGNIINIENNAAMVSTLGGPYHVQYTYNNLYRMTHAEGYHNTDVSAYVVDMAYHANGRIQRKAVRQRDELSRNGIKWYVNQYGYPSTKNTVTSIVPISTSGNMPSYLGLTGLHMQPPVPPSYRQVNNNHSFTWDGAGNMIQQTNNVNNSVRQLSWDEENRLQGVVDNSYLSLYQYDASGERTYKLTGSKRTLIRNGRRTISYLMDNATLYASPYVVCTPKGYTKHYYAENERIASKIGSGGISMINVTRVNPNKCAIKLGLNANHFDVVAQRRLNTTGYTTDTLLDTLYHWKTVQSNIENDCYWYHPDHLGSASWITQGNGSTVQYLYYLPWGEEHINQRRTGYAGSAFTFSAKERDIETGLSYFGSRYYSSDLSIWLSVDPQAAKYPSLSPFTYCADNPVKLVDPNGEEIGDPLKRMQVRRFSINNTFGPVRRNTDGGVRNHQGIDYHAPIGTPVYAIATGKVVRVNNQDNGGYGKYVTIQHYDSEGKPLADDDGNNVYSFYAHLSNINVKVGDDVIENETHIADSGESGNAKGMGKEDQHLHFEIRTQADCGKGLNNRKDPNEYVDTKYVIDENNPKKVKMLENQP